MSDALKNIKDPLDLKERLRRAKEAWDAMTPNEQAIASMRQRVGIVAAEMTVDDQDRTIRTREEANAFMAKTEPGLILAEIDRLRASLAEKDRLLAQKDRLLEAARTFATYASEQLARDSAAGRPPRKDTWAGYTVLLARAFLDKLKEQSNG